MFCLRTRAALNTSLNRRIVRYSDSRRTKNDKDQHLCTGFPCIWFVLSAAARIAHTHQLVPFSANFSLVKALSGYYMHTYTRCQRLGVFNRRQGRSIQRNNCARTSTGFPASAHARVYIYTQVDRDLFYRGIDAILNLASWQQWNILYAAMGLARATIFFFFTFFSSLMQAAD